VIAIDVCMETVFPELPYLDRPARIAEAGFKAVEAWFPDQQLSDDDLPKLRRACASAGVKLNNIVVNSPDGGIGGTLTSPADRPAYLERMAYSLKCCRQLGVSMMITCTGNVQPALTARVQRDSIIDGLKAAADLAAEAGVTLVLEPLNSLVDHHGYFLDNAYAAADIVRAVHHPNVAMLFDCYHMQIMGGNVIRTILDNLDVIRHFHSAGVPGRHELDDGELNYPGILDAIAAAGYQGCFGLEYFPKLESAASLAHMRELLPDR
jgi:hydroxypyruvate isomerase